MAVYEEIDKFIDRYNWDDGFSLPQKILEDQNCDLALALKIFYLGDGYGYLQIRGHVDPSDDWLQFISRLYSEILENKYQYVPVHHYAIPLTKVQKYKLAKQGISSIVWMEDSTLEEDFFVRTASELIPVEVKSTGGRSKSLRTLIDGKKYADIRYGIKFAGKNIGYSDNIYIFPYFCAFLLKRYLS